MSIAPVPFFPVPPNQYTQQYMAEVVRAFSVFATQITNPAIAKPILIEIPASAQALDEVGLLDEDYFMYFEDSDFCLRARRHGKQVHHAPVGEFLHEGGGTSKTVRLRTFLDIRRSQILFYLKHNGVAAAIAARGLLALGSALRVPPLAALSLIGGSERARAQLSLHWNGLAWLLNPFNGLVPDVDRSQ